MKPELKFQPQWVQLQVPLPAGHVNMGRWQICLFPTFWTRGRGGWPQRWRQLPPVDGLVLPIYRWWQLGPIEIRRYRWAHDEKM